MNIFKRLYNEIVEEIFSLTLNRKEGALILTLTILTFLVFAMFFVGLSQNQKEIFIEIFTEEKKQEEQLQEQNLSQDNLTSNAYNQTEKIINSDEEFKTLEQLIEENHQKEIENSQNNDQNEGNSSEIGENPSEESSKNQKEEPKTKEEPKKEQISSKNNQNKPKSFIEYSLVGRKYVNDFPNPVYTCDAIGTIVINIEVDKEGNVKHTSFNQASSTSHNKCLIDNALDYAKQAKFSRGSRTQIGTITYHYQPKL